MKGENFPLMHI